MYLYVYLKVETFELKTDDKNVISNIQFPFDIIAGRKLKESAQNCTLSFLKTRPTGMFTQTIFECNLDTKLKQNCSRNHILIYSIHYPCDDQIFFNLSYHIILTQILKPTSSVAC